MAQTDAQKRAKKKYDEKYATHFGLKLNRNTDADIIAHLEKMESKQGYVKKLIREDIERQK